MPTRVRAALFAVLLTVVSASCGGTSDLFGKQYEYEEDLTIALDGSATLVVNASIPSLVALRGLALDTDPNARPDRDAIRAMYSGPVTQVTRVSRPWKRNGRRFVQVRLKIADIRRLSETAPFAWSKYSLEPKGEQTVFTHAVGPSALKPGSLKNYGWNGRELVAFRLHLPSKILDHNSRDVDKDVPLSAERGNILKWEQYLADRLDGKPVTAQVTMESQSILYRTLWLFTGAFAAAVLALVLFIWWFMRRGRDEPAGV